GGGGRGGRQCGRGHRDEEEGQGRHVKATAEERPGRDASARGRSGRLRRPHARSKRGLLRFRSRGATVPVRRALPQQKRRSRHGRAEARGRVTPSGPER
ncbi:unnamed protein product, partial [Ectocarpus sp. 12 AP-2014]